MIAVYALRCGIEAPIPVSGLGKVEFLELQSEWGYTSYLCFEYDYVPKCLAHDIARQDGMQVAEYLNRKLLSMRTGICQ